MVANVAAAIVGIVLILASLNDVFQTVIVPRAVGRRFRPSSYWWRAIWRVWPSLAWRFHPKDEDNREDFLALFAPFTMVFGIVAWGVLLITGYALLFWAFRVDLAPRVGSIWDAIYFAGSSFLTIGFGDIVAKGMAPRMVSLAAGGSGLALFSVTITFLFSIFAAFQTREQFVVKVGARAGSPPSGVGLLVIAAHSEIVDSLPETMREAQTWAAQVMETHLAYPALGFFRSSHDYESWTGTLGSLLDAATLMMTTLDIPSGQARLFYNIGRHATTDLARYFRVASTESPVGIERHEFDRAYDRLMNAGFRMRDRDGSWDRFSAVRATYAANLSAMARLFQIPPLEWVGDRSLVSSPHIREQINFELLKDIVPATATLEPVEHTDRDDKP